MADLTLTLTDQMYATLVTKKTVKARTAKAAEYVSVFEHGTVANVLEQFATRRLADANKAELVKLATDVLKKELTKPLLALFVRATALGATLVVRASETDNETGEPTKATLAIQESKKSNGTKGSRWSYFLDSKPLLKSEGGEHSSVKAALDSMSTAGNTDAKAALEALAASKLPTHAGWKLNGWTASQSIPALAARFTRSR